MDLLINAGPHARYDTPMSIDLGEAAKGRSQARLTEADTGRSIPCQLGSNQLAFILPCLGAREERRYRVYLHRGDAQRGEVAAKWSDYVFPPTVKKA
jgi:hypothetical protein